MIFKKFFHMISDFQFQWLILLKDKISKLFYIIFGLIFAKISWVKIPFLLFVSFLIVFRRRCTVMFGRFFVLFEWEKKFVEKRVVFLLLTFVFQSVFIHFKTSKLSKFSTVFRFQEIINFNIWFFVLRFICSWFLT